MMCKLNIILLSFVVILNSCETRFQSQYKIEGNQSKIIVSMIEAVNEKDAEKYVIGFAENVAIYVEGDLKVNGRESLKTNRANHFKRHPQVRSEIQHIVEIDDKVILHDKVWLDESDQSGQDIVEIFTFVNGEVSRVDVIQPKSLFPSQEQAK